jgi:SAM-dependent methyltransferase
VTVLSPTACRNGMRELLDGDDLDPQLLAGNLREIRLINRYLGWNAASVRLVEQLAREAGLCRFRYLDVATGSGDLPRAVLQRAARLGWEVDVAALDYSPTVLAAARDYLRDALITLYQGDARALPFPDRHFDVVSFALALHHFTPDEAAQILRELARVARHAWLVVDAERSLPAYLGVRAMRLLLRNPLTRHDAPASVLRAYTLPELRGILDRAGLHQAHAARQFPFRLVACGRR